MRRLLDRPRYFECIDTQAKAYHLGLIVADGSIADRSTTWRTSIALAQEDRVSRDGNERTALQRLREAVGSDAKLCRSKDPKPHGLPGFVYGVGFGSNEMAMDLQMHGVFPRKSEDPIGVAPALVPLDLTPHFGRGLLDGDGGIELYLDPLPTGYVFWERRPYWDNSLRVLEWMLAQFRSLKIVRENETKVRPSHNSHRLQIAGIDARSVLKALYEDAGDLYFLRKWKRAHMHPLDWEDFDGDPDGLPPRFQEKHKTGPKIGTTRDFDYDAIARDIQACELAYWEIEKKHGCSRQVINTVKRMIGGGRRTRIDAPHAGRVRGVRGRRP